MDEPTEMCRVCGSDIHEIRGPFGPHYGKRACGAGHFNGWIPHPPMEDNEIPAAIRGLIVDRAREVVLRGTPAQVAAAKSIRWTMTRRNQYVGQAWFNRLVYCVTDATWFLANRGRGPYDLKCWPRADQMSPIEAETRR